MSRLIHKLVILGLFLCAFTPVLAKTAAEYQSEIQELEAKISSLKNQADTLANQVAYYDSQISLTAIKISQTEELINTLSAKIIDLEGVLDQSTQILVDQIIYTYKTRKLDPFQLFLANPSFTKYFNQRKYISLIQEHNRNFIHDAQLAQTTYEDQKTLLVESQKKLNIQKASLAGLRLERDNLLKQTKNNEATYQKQLEQAKLELQAINSALASASRVGPVKAGDPIALTGNSGYPSCSTGKHLHFEVRKNDTWVNSETYLKPITDKWGLKIGTGNWDWPLKGQIEITQRYGKTNYSYRYSYSGGIHTGIDMLSDNDVIYAPADGTLYASTEKCGTSILKVKYIDHGSGLKTLYLHVQ
jgi:septal ring factor EnvC (AmiA/AmiB activator)